MTVDHSFWQYILQAGLLVKVVMLILLVLSVVSWTLIFQRLSIFRQTQKDLEQFKSAYVSAKNLTALYQHIDKRPILQKGQANIFHAAMRACQKLNQRSINSTKVWEANIDRAMRVMLSKEEHYLENHLNILATIGSTTPYIGLFGTVWGIMTSFQSLGVAQQATIAMVAPGISEALIATAMGLFAAIPAVIAYNRLSHMAGFLCQEYENFMDTVMNDLMLSYSPAVKSASLASHTHHAASASQRMHFEDELEEELDDVTSSSQIA